MTAFLFLLLLLPLIIVVAVVSIAIVIIITITTIVITIIVRKKGHPERWAGMVAGLAAGSWIEANMFSLSLSTAHVDSRMEPLKPRPSCARSALCRDARAPSTAKSMGNIEMHAHPNIVTNRVLDNMF